MADENEALKGKHTISKERIRELESELDGVKNKLVEGSALESGNLVLDVGSMVQKLQQYSINYAGELASLRVENEELRDTLGKENERFEEISAEYYNRVSQMNKQIERLNSAVDVNEQNSSEILRKCQAYEDEITTIQNEAEKKERDHMRVV